MDPKAVRKRCPDKGAISYEAHLTTSALAYQTLGDCVSKRAKIMYQVLLDYAKVERGKHYLCDQVSVCIVSALRPSEEPTPTYGLPSPFP